MLEDSDQSIVAQAIKDQEIATQMEESQEIADEVRKKFFSGIDPKELTSSNEVIEKL